MNIDNIIDKVRYTVNTHKLENTGEYARYLWQDENNSRKMGLNEYGVADAANILYTIGDFPSDTEEREAYIKVLQGMQNRETGLFEEHTHHVIHTTAHCAAALELFDKKPLYPLYELLKYKDKDMLYSLLDNLNWELYPWPCSHQGAGIYAAFRVCGIADAEWKKWYFDWMWENADPESGFWKKNVEKKAELYEYMAGGFHYFFNHEDAHMPVRYPEKMIDSCLKMYRDGSMKNKNSFGRDINFIEVDWIYCMNRASRYTSHRYEEVKEALREMGRAYVDFLGGIDEKSHDRFNDLHMLFGAVCALAELQAALPGEFTTDKPLKLVLNRRPFI